MLSRPFRNLQLAPPIALNARKCIDQWGNLADYSGGLLDHPIAEPFEVVVDLDDGVGQHGSYSAAGDADHVGVVDEGLEDDVGAGVGGTPDYGFAAATDRSGG